MPSQGFWRLFSESLSALAFNLLGLVAGLAFACFSTLFASKPWGLRAYPCILTVRGVVGGLVCGRLSSGLWLGTVRPSLTGNTEEFKIIYHTALVLSSAAALMMGPVVWLYGLPAGLGPGEALEATAALLFTMTLAFLTTMPIPALTAFTAFRHGVNPDVVTYPVGSTSSDVLVTCCFAGAVALASLGQLGLVIEALTGAAFLASGAVVLFSHRRDGRFLRALKEGLLASSMAIAISGLTGLLLADVQATIGLWPGLCLVYPAIMSTMGDVGSVVGSTATTKLAIGTMEPGLRALKGHSREIGAAWAASLLMFSSYGIISALVFPGGPGPGFFLIALLITNLVAFWAVVSLSLLAGMATYRHGLDPDNFVIPVESSAADALTTLALLLALGLVAGVS